MNVELVTKEDLQILREGLKSDFIQVLRESLIQKNETIEGYKSKHVRKVLDCSLNKLQSLRIAGKIRFKKIGGTVYYNKKDVQKLLTEGF